MSSSPSSQAVPIHGHCDPRFENVRNVFAERLASGDEVGAAIAFTLEGESVVDLWGGHTDETRAQEWERDTIVNTYSTTKGMTALVAHQLIEQDRIRLDEPVATYWPEFARAGKDKLPVRWLLSHQVGLPAIRRELPPATLYDWDAICTALAEEAPWWEPGTQHGYHPVTYGFLVGEVIRRATGKTVGELFREHVADPLQADFHIGLDPKHHHRVSDLIGGLVQGNRQKGAKTKGDEARKPAPGISGPLADFMRDMTDPTTMVGAAFNNPRIRSGAHNTPEWRQAEIPAANGHGNARALARIYGALACDGAVDGVRLLEPESIVRARTEQASGPDATLAKMPMRYGLGFMLRSKFMPMTPNDSSFGHPGAGGSIGWADPEAGVGFGFVMNKMGAGFVGGTTGFAVLRAFFEAR